MSAGRRAVIGIDGGGTSIRVLIADDRGRELGRGQAGPALVDRIGEPIDVPAVVAAVKEVAAGIDQDLPAAALCAGLAGVGRAEDRQAVRDALDEAGVADLVRVVTDAEAAFFDAFEDGPGILLIAGTGSIALGRGEDGREARVGGWGALLGDEGSAYDIGLRALRAATWATDGRGPATKLVDALLSHLGMDETEDLRAWASGAGKSGIAALAPLVWALARKGDDVAAEIVDGAVTALVAHAATLLRRLGPWTSPARLALMGGLLEPGGPLREAVVADLAHRGCEPLEQAVDPAAGAVGIAIRQLGSGP